MNAFHTQIQKSLANKNLQAALDFNAGKRDAARLQSIQTLTENIQALRLRAHAIRLDTISNLNIYLEQFISNLEKNGVMVHRAQTTQDALNDILAIIRSNNARLVAKSKSMVSEEIGLNHHLEQEGIEAIETDLGEYIVQLRGEPPAHIITPAVHLSRQDVGELFSQKLGVPYTEDIPTLTGIARQVLRQTFLDAEIGFSGVNFGVADTGTLCIVTNEGNGRMVTTLPPVHIALMGMERLVPSQADLALMLQLLPRSATGQKLSVYTSLINTPRQVGELDGPRERHLILLDNGRSTLRSSDLSDALLCIRCGACLNVCPVFQELGGHGYVNLRGQISPYSGPIGSVISPGLLGIPEYGHLARASSLCGACKEACPIDIDLPKLLLRVRAGGSITLPPKVPMHVPRAVNLGLNVFSFIATHPHWFSFSQKLASTIFNGLFPQRHFIPLPSITGWGYGKDFPKLSKNSFQQLWKNGCVKNTSHPITAHPDHSLHNGGIAPNFQTVSWVGKLKEQFSCELENIGGKVIACNLENLSIKIIETLSTKGIYKISAWDKTDLPVGLLEQIKEQGIAITDQIDPSIRAGLTGSIGAVADSGSIWVPGGSGRPLTASLLPSLHLAILDSNNIYPNLDSMFVKIKLNNFSSSVIITGPSRTADIEMALTIGVHGPQEIIVFLIN